MRPVGGCWAPAGIGDDVAAGTEACSRVAALRSETGRHFPHRLRPICARDRWRRDGSPHGTATVLRNTSVERRRKADDGLRREDGAPRAHRCRVRCREAGEGPGPAARVPGACRPAGPARRRGDPGPEVDKREVRRAHRGRRAHPGGRRTRSFMPRGKSLLSTPPVEKERSALGGEAVALLAPPLRFWQAPGIGAPLISLAR